MGRWSRAGARRHVSKHRPRTQLRRRRSWRLRGWRRSCRRRCGVVTAHAHSPALPTESGPFGKRVTALRTSRHSIRPAAFRVARPARPSPGSYATIHEVPRIAAAITRAGGVLVRAPMCDPRAVQSTARAADANSVKSARRDAEHDRRVAMSSDVAKRGRARSAKERTEASRMRRACTRNCSAQIRFFSSPVDCFGYLGELHAASFAPRALAKRRVVNGSPDHRAVVSGGQRRGEQSDRGAQKVGAEGWAGQAEVLPVRFEALGS
jgi:hypothetical protein